jgi:predicted PurR-regulated permease PerM
MKSIIPGDWAGGSMLDAHNCGIFIALYGLTLILPGLTQKGKPFPLSSVFFLKKALPALFFLLITDAKTIYLVVLVSLLIFLLFTWLKNTFSKILILSSRKVFAYLTLLVFSFLLIPILAQAYVRFALDNSEADLTEVVGAYLFDEENTLPAIKSEAYGIDLNQQLRLG